MAYHKIGSPRARKECADFARAARARFPALKGAARSDWYTTVYIATHNRLTRLIRDERDQRIDQAMLEEKTPAAQARRDHRMLEAQQQRLANEGRL